MSGTPRAGSSLAGRAVLAGCLVALVSVLATAVVAIPLANQAARRQAAEALAAEADLLAAAVRARPALADRAPVRRQAVTAQLARQGVTLWWITDGEPDRAGLPEPALAPLRAGRPVSLRVTRVAGQLSLVEGRPLAGGDAVVLSRPFASGIGAAVLARLWLPLLVGLGAGGLAGTLLGRRLARPVRQAAVAAAQLRGGDRRVRVPEEPPAETAELARALNELARALATSEHRQREFLLSVSHELRTPLTTIKGYAEALADGVVEPGGVAGTGELLRSQADQLERLVTDLLALARLAADDFQLALAEVDLTAMVAEVAAGWEPRCAQAGVEWRCHTPAGPVPVVTDPGRLRQVLDGLLGNALRVVPAGVAVVLELTAAGPAGEVVLQVRDGGPGLTDEDLAVAFERGALTERYRGVRAVGSGLGLALAAGLVRRLGGTIQAGHAPEGGARFTITLPVTLYRTRT